MNTIKEKLKENNLNVNQLSIAIGETPQRMRYFINECKYREYKTLKKISDFLKCNVDELIS